MTRDLKARWIAALRSGTYRQGRLRLRSRKGTFCCLGVLCEVAGVPFETVHMAYRFSDNMVFNSYLGGALRQQLPQSAQDALAAMNDSDRKSFQEIADWIETHIPTEDEATA